jgi:hypothetical protein
MMHAKLVLLTLKHVWEVLRPLNLPMAVMGGIALATWKHVRATKDVDLLVALGQADLQGVLQTLAAAQIRPKRQPPVLALGDLRLVQLLYEPPEAFLDLQIDLLLADSEYQQAAIARRRLAQLPGLEMQVDVLTCEDLILHKLLAGRLLDRADAAALVRLNRPTLDVAYLTLWTRKLALGPALDEAWEEAFPGERFPTRADPAEKPDDLLGPGTTGAQP